MKIIQKQLSNFRAGKKFQKGEILLRIDDEVYKNSLFAQKSNLLNQLTLLLPDLKIDFPQEYQKWDDYLANFEISKSFNIYKLFYDIKSIEATYLKFFITAPFDGSVTDVTKSKIANNWLIQIIFAIF